MRWCCFSCFATPCAAIPSAIRLLFPLIDRYRDSPEAPNAKSPEPRTVIILPSNGREIEQEPDDKEAGARQRRRRPR